MLLLKNASYINPETLEISNRNILVEKGAEGGISFIDTISDIKDRIGIKLMDCNEKLVTHSFVNAHHHAYSALSRGMPQPKVFPANFSETLAFIWWKLDKALTMDMIRLSAYASAIASAKAGSTFVIDHHSSPYAVEGSLEVIANAFDEVGISHLLCYEISDRDGIEIAEKGLAETDNYLKNRQGLVGLHASFTVGNKTLRKAVDLAEKFKTGIHVHTAEDSVDQELTMQNYGCSVVERFSGEGVLHSPATILAHCLHLSDKERKLLKNSGVYIAQNCESNLNNKVGHFTSKGLNNNIMIGTDGMHSDMLRSSQASYFIGLNHEEMSPGIALTRLTKAGNYLDVNNFKGNSENNLLIFEYDSPTPVSRENLPGHFYYGLTSANIQHVISKGKLIVEDRKVLNVNESEIMTEARGLAELLWKKL